MIRGRIFVKTATCLYKIDEKDNKIVEEEYL